MQDMQSTGFTSEKDRLRVLLERILREARATNEGISAIREMLADKPNREEFNELKQDIKAIKAAVTMGNGLR